MKEEVEYVCSSVKRSVADADGEEDKEREREEGGRERAVVEVPRKGSVKHREEKFSLEVLNTMKIKKGGLVREK